MSLNLYSLIIKVANEKGQNVTLGEIGEINNKINSLIERGINKNWIIINNLECFI